MSASAAVLFYSIKESKSCHFHKIWHKLSRSKTVTEQSTFWQIVGADSAQGTARWVGGGILGVLEALTRACTPAQERTGFGVYMLLKPVQVYLHSAMEPVDEEGECSRRSRLGFLD